MNALEQERQYLDMISQREVKYQKYVFKLYNETLLAESLVIGPTIFDKDKATEQREIVVTEAIGQLRAVNTIKVQVSEN